MKSIFDEQYRVVAIEGDSYRLREAQERQQRRTSSRRRSKDAPPTPSTT